MPIEKKSDRKKKAGESKTASKKTATKGTKSTAAADHNTAKPDPELKPALKRTRAKKPAPAQDASHPEQPLDSTQPSKPTTDSISHDHISVRAYYLSEELRACGEQWDSEKIWLEAERQIRAERK
jgi:hypothetical protein